MNKLATAIAVTAMALIGATTASAGNDASYCGATHVEQGLLLVVATGGVAVAMVLMGRLSTRSPVGRARASRLLNVAEQLLVVMLVVLAFGTSGLFDWTHQVLR